MPSVDHLACSVQGFGEYSISEIEQGIWGTERAARETVESQEGVGIVESKGRDSFRNEGAGLWRQMPERSQMRTEKYPLYFAMTWTLVASLEGCVMN